MSVKTSYIKWSRVCGLTNQVFMEPFMGKTFVTYVTASYELNKGNQMTIGVFSLQNIL